MPSTATTAAYSGRSRSNRHPCTSSVASIAARFIKPRAQHSPCKHPCQHPPHIHPPHSRCAFPHTHTPADYRIYYAYTYKPLAHLPLAHKRMLIQHSTLPGQSAAHGSSATWARSQQLHARDQAAGHAVHAMHHEQQAQQLVQQALDTSQQLHLAQEALHASKQRQQAGHGPHSTQEPPHHVVSVCDDSCSVAQNGKCDDGRKGNISQVWLGGQVAWNHVRCDLGKDCADCGPAYIRLPLSR
jgi:hypothetical protein